MARRCRYWTCRSRTKCLVHISAPKSSDDVIAAVYTYLSSVTVLPRYLKECRPYIRQVGTID